MKTHLRHTSPLKAIFKTILATFTVLLASAGSHAMSPAVFAATTPAIGKANLETVRIVRLNMPINLTAADMMSKVFGCVGTKVPRHNLCSEARRVMNLTPTRDEFGYWLEKDNGYNVSYYGMTPEVSAVAIYNNEDVIDNFCYFFMFPYTEATRDTAVHEQADFCGSLLQEMSDLGLEVYTLPDSDALVDAMAEYGNSLVEVRLMDEAIKLKGGDSQHRFLVVLRVAPNAFSEADHITASLSEPSRMKEL